MKRMRLSATNPVCVLAMLMSGMAHAQTLPTPPNLSDFVNNASNGATLLQQEAGNAIQRTCGNLANPNRPTSPQGAELDLLQRCNELVETGRLFEDSSITGPGVDRSLGFDEADTLLGVIQQYAGEESTAVGDLATQAPSGQMANIAGRLNALRFGGASASSRGRVASFDAPARQVHPAHDAWSGFEADSSRSLRNGVLPLQSLLSDAETQGASSETVESGIANPWGWFLEASYGFGDRDRTARENGFDFDAGSLTFGIDYNFGSSVLGASLGYDSYKAEFDEFGVDVLGGEATVEGLSGSIFYAAFGDKWSFSAIASYGSPESDIERLITYQPDADANCEVEPTPPLGLCGAERVLTGSPDTQYFAIGTTVGYEFELGSWDLAPSLSYSLREADVDGYEESVVIAEGDPSDVDGLELAYASQSIDSQRLIVALALSRSISRGFGILTPVIRAEFHHEFEDEERTVEAKFNALSGFDPSTQNNDFGDAACISCFEILTNGSDADFGLVGAGLTFLFPNRVQAYVYAETLLKAELLTSSAIALGIRAQF